MKQIDPNPEAVALWLKQMSRDDLHNQGWIEVNKRFYGITRAARPFLNKHYADKKERQAAYDGLTLALLAMAHFEDIEKLDELFVTLETQNQSTG